MSQVSLGEMKVNCNSNAYQTNRTYNPLGHVEGEQDLIQQQCLLNRYSEQYSEHEIGCCICLSVVMITYPSTRLLNEVIESYLCEALYQDGNGAAYELDHDFWNYSAELSV